MAKSRRWTYEDMQSINNKDIAAKTGAKAAKTTISANALTKHALKLLDLHGWQVWRNNNAGVYSNTKKVWRANSTTKGIPDIIGYHRKTALFISVEIKVGRDKLSVEQNAFLEDLKKSGGIALVIRSIDELEFLFKTKEL